MRVSYTKYNLDLRQYVHLQNNYQYDCKHECQTLHPTTILPTNALYLRDAPRIKFRVRVFDSPDALACDGRVIPIRWGSDVECCDRLDPLRVDVGKEEAVPEEEGGRRRKKEKKEREREICILEWLTYLITTHRIHTGTKPHRHKHTHIHTHIHTHYTHYTRYTHYTHTQQ